MSNETTKAGNAGFAKIAPVMLAFFVMGFVDLVGTATNYVKTEFLPTAPRTCSPRWCSSGSSSSPCRPAC